MANILMNRTRSEIIRFLIGHGPATFHEVAVALDRTAPALGRHLNLLCQAGILILEAGRYSAQPDEIERQSAELLAAFQSADSDFKKLDTAASHFSVSPFHSNE
jgi:predicted transcriptional regulator